LGVRVFSLRGIYRRKDGIMRWARWPHHLVAQPGARPHHPIENKFLYKITSLSVERWKDKMDQKGVIS
jgi:hypothetical protein